MPLSPRKGLNYPDMWTTFAHSWFQYAFGTADQTGRADSVLRAAMHIENTQWRNYAVNGARLVTEGKAQGGYVRLFQECANYPGRGGPYAGTGGGAVFCYGINDLGFNGFSAAWIATFKETLRASISRWRSATVFENDFQVGTRTSYGAGFSSVTATDFSSGSAQTVHWATALTNANFTCTLPSDYNGEPVAICFVGPAGAAGGTVTWSGTAGITGTTNLSSTVPAGGTTHTAIVKRITTLTSANAGQTIIGTVTALDAGGAVMLDCWWLEALNAPPVVVCDVARLTTAGYTIYSAWTGTEAAKDQNVLDLNTAIAQVVAEFDTMVQIAYCDVKVGKNAALLFDGLHPNELGAAAVVDSLLDAISRLRPTTNLGDTANMNTFAPRSASLRIPRISGRYYTTDYRVAASAAALTSGNMWAMPFLVTESRERYTTIALQMLVGGGTAHIWRWGLYDDPQWSGYPNCLYSEPTVSTPKNAGTTQGLITDTTIAWPLDPGLWWIVLKCTQTGLTQTVARITGPDAWGVMPQRDTSATAVDIPDPIAWFATGQGTAAFPGQFPATGFAPTNIAPAVLLKKA